LQTPLVVWIAFNGVVLALLSVDLLVIQRKAHAVRMGEAIGWSAFWITLALLFNASLYLFPSVYGIPHAERGRYALEFLTGYLVEESLSMDNLFVFLMIFSYFQVSPKLRHKALFWGILGAMIMRALFIVLGIALIHRFEWIIYIFGALLIYSAWRMAVSHGMELHPESNPVLMLLRKLLPVTRDYEGERFFVRRDGRLWATPLFVVLVFIEASDLMFAVDSIPAVLAITREPFIAYSSNICAILGLRALFFALAGLMGLFRFLHYGLVGILAFVGAKMLLHDVLHVPTLLSLGVIAGALAGSIAASLAFPEKSPPSAPPNSPG
jgi:tellurite resistance protein TerC